eukprot:5951070-Lingulodinium_polyedra.AAC.1
MNRDIRLPRCKYNTQIEIGLRHGHGPMGGAGPRGRTPPRPRPRWGAAGPAGSRYPSAGSARRGT